MFCICQKHIQKGKRHLNARAIDSETMHKPYDFNMSFFKVAYHVVLEWTYMSVAPLEVLPGALQRPLDFLSHKIPQLPLTPVQPSTSTLQFSPDGSSANFQCNYNLDSSVWESCNSADARDCWIRQINGNLNYTINTDCRSRLDGHRAMLTMDKTRIQRRCPVELSER